MIKHSRIALTLFIVCVYLLSFSQETPQTEIRGSLLDAQSQEPLLVAWWYITFLNV